MITPRLASLSPVYHPLLNPHFSTISSAFLYTQKRISCLNPLLKPHCKSDSFSHNPKYYALVMMMMMMMMLKLTWINKKCAFARLISGSRVKKSVLVCLSPQEQQKCHLGNIMKIRGEFSMKIVQHFIDCTRVSLFPQGDWENSSVDQTTKLIK